LITPGGKGKTMKATTRSIVRSRADHGHPVVVGSTVVVAAVMGLAVKATAGMRGQTVRELVRGGR
jgi:hypothetical protein